MPSYYVKMKCFALRWWGKRYSRRLVFCIIVRMASPRSSIYYLSQLFYLLCNDNNVILLVNITDARILYCTLIWDLQEITIAYKVIYDVCYVIEAIFKCLNNDKPPMINISFIGKNNKMYRIV